MSRLLKHAVVEEAVRFWCEQNGASVPVAVWAVEPVSTADGREANPGTLLAMADDGSATMEGEGAILVDGPSVAGLEAWQARALGLPPDLPFSLKILRSGLLTDRDLSLTYQFVTLTGLVLVDTSRHGPTLESGGRRYRLTEPMYSLVIALDDAAASRTNRFEERAPQLERIQALLADTVGDSVSADRYLRETRITSASAFTIRPSFDARGNVDFDIQPVRVRPNDGAAPQPALASAREADWNGHFRALSLRSCYPAGGGHYLVVTPALQRALSVAKTIANRAPAEKRAFVRNPRAFLREALPDLPDDALESVFWESSAYSDRVREIGLWQPRVLPFLKSGGMDWLPEEGMGFQIGDEVLTIKPREAREVLEKLEAARVAGAAGVEHGGRTIPVTDESIEAAKELVRITETFGPEPTERERPRKVEAESGRIVLLIEDNLEQQAYARRVRRRSESRREGPPESLRSSLLSFQAEGYRWLQELWACGAPGALLADDMGLGKTLQALAFLAWVRSNESARADRLQILTVAPTGLLKNWLAEYDKHLGGDGLGDVLSAHGEGLADLRSTGGGTRELAAGVPTLDVERLRSADWVLTTYEALRDYQHSFGSIRWEVAVLDEAQKIKNPKALMTDAAKALNVDFTIALTGTPVENRLADLWCITDAVEPGRLGALKDFVSQYEASDADADRLRRLKRRLDKPDPPLLLRRTKQAELSGLPPITVHRHQVPMPDIQAEAYSQVVSKAKAGGKGQMLSALQDLRAVSLHPRAELSLGRDQEFIEESARLKHAMSILDDIRVRGEKALVFVEARAMQAALVELLQRRFTLPEPPLVINGELAGDRRLARVEGFEGRPGFSVMILSPRAGGVGLTITAANHVIHLSRWWNPAVEDQATDRVYRIGQSRPVHVYTPLAVHPTFGEASFDALLDGLLQKKRTLSRDLLAPPQASDRDLGELYDRSVDGQT